MPTYVFKGRNRVNEVVTGERVADNREALRQVLRREQVTLTSVKENHTLCPRCDADHQ